MKKQLAKKKGPKGKKARAKAKLDRQWGESVDENALQKSRVRRGRSRTGMLSKSGTGVQQTTRENHDNQGEKNAIHDTVGATMPYNDDPLQVETSSESDSEEDDLGEDSALSQLLRTINKKSRITRRVVAAEFEEVSDDKYDDESSIDVDEDMEEQEDLKVEDDENLEEGIESDSDDEYDAAAESRGSKEDAFSSHFNRPPLAENRIESSSTLSSQATHKVPMSHLNPSLELQLSGSSSAERKWKDTANESFEWTRKVLKQNWRKANKAAMRSNADGADEVHEKDGCSHRFSSLQQMLYPSMTRYADILTTAENRENRDGISNLTALHILNHVLTSRSRVQKHNRKIKDANERKAEREDAPLGHDTVDEERWRDQGYTRPKVLILLPTAGACRSFMRRMLALLGESAFVKNMDRFEAEYGAPVVDNEELAEDDATRRRRKSVLEAKGPEWQELFGENVNDDDDFKIGMALTPNAVGSSKNSNKQGGGGVTVKLYSEFYHSDVIMASPLALKMSTTSNKDEEDVDFLSSIEICLIGHANVLMMQNWDHVNDALDLINQQPKKNNDTDFSRVRNYLLAGQAAQWRQLIICSTLSDPYILSTFKRHSKSIGGKLKLRRRVPTDEASLCDVLVNVKQVFQRVPCKSFANQGNDKVQYFAERVLPQITRQKHTLIFIPSYFDFVSIRNHLLKKEASFVSVTEYSRVSEVSRGRARFLQGRKPIMLYTGRSHFFSRHKIKGARHIVFFGLPEHPEFFSGMTNVLNGGLSGLGAADSTLDLEKPASCLALFTKYDAHALERIVGSQHCERMLKAEKGTFMFCS